MASSIEPEGEGDATSHALSYRVAKLYRKDIYSPDQPRRCIGRTYWAAGHDIRYGEGDKERLSSAKTSTLRLEESSQLLLDAVSFSCNNVDDHFQQLDDAFSTLLLCQWQPKQSKSEEIVDFVIQLISRLRTCPMSLPDDVQGLPAVCFENGTKDWHNLSVAFRLSSNTIRLIIEKAYSHYEPGEGYLGLNSIINSTGRLIETCVHKSRATTSAVDKQRWMVVRGLLWNFWQRIRTIDQALSLALEFREGFTHGNESRLWLRDFSVSDQLSLSAYTKAIAKRGKASNLCSWAFELVRTDPFCLGLDFEHLHNRWQSALGSNPTRCSTTCDGSHPHRCLRYKGLKVKNQSMHDQSCTLGVSIGSEPTLKWDRGSYTAVEGPHAVSIGQTNPTIGPLKYCAASGRTLAISHVWSHGQGGRPETGINQCLHRRYTEIAGRLGCDSYWMDVPCIPSEHQLRKDEIRHINRVFSGSKAVLVCDLDLMTIDVNALTTEKHEEILCAVLLCDWNLRAWTLLEGLKGRRNVLILCKDNQILRLRDTMEHLSQYGSLTILAFAYLLGPILPPHPRAETRNLKSLLASTIGSWLSHRPASRAGDDVVIWSLLRSTTAEPIADAKVFWRSQTWVYAGYLLSTAERLKDPGLSWAPKTPYTIPTMRMGGKVPEYHRPMFGGGSGSLHIDEQGITGEWWLSEFQSKWSTTLKGTRSLSATEAELLKVRSKLLRLGFMCYGALLKPIANEEFEDTPSMTSQGTLLAVCQTDGQYVREHPRIWNLNIASYRWIWRGVYEWPAEVPLPEFVRDRWVWIN